MTTLRDVQGIIPVVHTPFLADDSIDVDGVSRQLDWAQSLAIGGYCTGMVSELLRLTETVPRQAQCGGR